MSEPMMIFKVSPKQFADLLAQIDEEGSDRVCRTDMPMNLVDEENGIIYLRDTTHTLSRRQGE